MREPGVEDATRRTRLANERTYLAWWRTGLTALAVCIGLGKLVPGVTDHATRWPYALVGAGFGVLGIAFLVLGYRRAGQVEDALNRGTFAELDSRLSLALVAFGTILGIATVLIVLFAK
jgi:putative membrane protein